ncbi:MAG: hypothetical protein HYY09_05875 [Firmicutes bacterium]|nr:hypothetical protein [Bacillota bacterium]
MVDMFWVGCPKCRGTFCAATRDFKGQDREMICPFCSHAFKDTEGVEPQEGTGAGWLKTAK